MRVTERIRNAWHVFKAPSAGKPAVDTTASDIDKVNLALLPLLFLGFAAAIRVGWDCSRVGPVLLWCVACLAVGAVLGFLFGIPRSGGVAGRQQPSKTPAPTGSATGAGQPPRAERPVGANTNLEEVSDWLTKIIVGLSLVHFKEIETRFAAVSRKAEAALHPTPDAQDVSIAMALIIAFLLLGFLLCYLYTRLFLEGAFIRSLDFKDVVKEEIARAAPDSAPPTGEPLVPSVAQKMSAERVLQVVTPERPGEVLEPLRKLAAEYERVRNVMPFGQERTLRMSEIASGMRSLALAAAPFLATLAASPSPGERLAAVMILQMRFDPQHIDWLADRLVEEAAFIGYQAASVLLVRLRIAGGQEAARIQAAVARAWDRRVALKLAPEEKRDALIEQILKAFQPPADKT